MGRVQTFSGGGVASYKFWPVFAYSNGKSTDIFRGTFFGLGEGGWREGAVWKDISLEEYVMGEEKFKWGAEFSTIIMKKIEKINMK